MEKDYTALREASTYDIVQEDTEYEPEFVVGTTYSWEEVIQHLINWNAIKGNDERQQYLQICLGDKEYYFADI